MGVERHETAVNASAPLRLSPQQQRVWRSQDGAQTGPYIAHCLVVLDREVPEPDLRAAVRAVIDRYEILRTAYSTGFGASEPKPSVCQHADALPATMFAGASGALDVAGDIAWEPPTFALQDGDVLRVHVLPPRDGRSVLRLILPALCADRVTLRLLARAIADLCTSRSGVPAEADAPVQYGAIAAWEHDLLFEPEAQVGIAYWRSRLRDAPPPRRLPGEAASVSLPFRPQRYGTVLDPAVYRALETLTRRFGATPSAGLVLGWQILLARFTDTTDTIVGVFFDGRQEPGLETAVGPLGRYLPLRVQYRDDRTLKDAIREVAREMHEAGAWQECFVWNALAEPGVAEPFLPVLIEMTDERESSVLGVAKLEILDEYVCADRFHIRIRLRSNALQVDYDAARFEPATIERLASRLLRIVDEICLRPDRRSGDFAMVDQEERRRILGRLSAGHPPAIREPPVHVTFEAVCGRQPDHVAVVANDQVVTYGALNAAANRLAHALQKSGIGPEHVVAVIADRSPGLVISVLGILKAGAAFLPIDPEAPPRRTRAVLDRARPSALIAPGTTALVDNAGLGRAAAFALIHLQGEAARLAEQPSCDPPCAVGAAHAAYLIFTSGSMGEPKGIVIEHGALANHMAWITREFMIAADDRVLQRTPLSFDAAIWELFAPLLTGGVLVLAGHGADFDIDQVVGDVLCHDVSVVQFVPGLLRLALNSGLDAARSRLRLLCCGGDALPSNTWAAVTGKLGLAAVNLYGPAETCIDATFWQGPALPPSSNPLVPIGRPIAGVSAIVLDGGGDVAPVDMPGELCIAGAGLARGYLGRPDETAAAFIPHPWSSERGARLYRSGDWARWRPDGHLDYLGRRDARVKIRGVRVELDDIAAALMTDPAVGDCAVLSRESERGSKELVAFVELAGRRPEAAEMLDRQWQRHLRSQLPEALVPTRLKVVAALPRSRSGKIDRLALQEIPLTEPFVAPRTPVEARIAAVWREVLGVERISISDNFFALGGHSVLLTKVMVRLRDALGVNVPLRTLFDAPTIDSLARALEQGRDASDAA
jgi:amino acid adenylation domain-containing protein